MPHFHCPPFLLLLFSVASGACTLDPLQAGTVGVPHTADSSARTLELSFGPAPVAVTSRTLRYLPVGNVRCGLADKSGNLWFGTWLGIARYDGEAFTFFTRADSLTHPEQHNDLQDIYTIFQDRVGHIWFGAQGGAYRYDGKTITRWVLPVEVDRTAQQQQGALSPMHRTTVLSILQDKRGHLWFGTHGAGAYRYDGTALQRYTTADGLCHDVVQDIAEDTTGNLWFATRGGGVCRYDGRSVVHFPSTDVVGNHVFFIATDRTGVPWIGTVGGGLRRADGEGFAPVTEPDVLNATSMLVARNGDTWFTSDGRGACQYDGHHYARFTTKEGLCSNAVWTVVEDKAANLWFCTRNGLCRYNGKAFTAFGAPGP